MQIAAIDPGISGAVAFVNKATRQTSVHDLPVLTLGKRRTVDPYALGDLLSVHQPAIVVIEHVATRPGQGISSSGNFMYGAGVLFGVCGALGIETDFIPPAVWKRGLNLLGTSKEASRSLAIRLFPEMSASLKRKKDSDRAEALLIGHHYVLKLGGYEVSSRPRRKAIASVGPLPNTPSPSLRVARRDNSILVSRREDFQTQH